MEVSPEFSRLTGFTPGDNQPIIDKRTATTTLNVANRQTIVIGGLRQRDDVGDFKGIPYLKDLRLVRQSVSFPQYRRPRKRAGGLHQPRDHHARRPAQPSRSDGCDTLGCRLNMIPEAEGCPPPPCVLRTADGRCSRVLSRRLHRESTCRAIAAAGDKRRRERRRGPGIRCCRDDECRTAWRPTCLQTASADVSDVATGSRDGRTGNSDRRRRRRSHRLQRLPAVATPPTVPIVATRPVNLFDPPPRVDIGLPSEDDSKVHIGGSVEFGYRQ